jgi:hypothetical protein
VPGASVTSTSREARAHLRNYSVVIPPDCVAAINQEDGKHALDYMQRALNAQILESASIDFKKLKSEDNRALSSSIFSITVRSCRGRLALKFRSRSEVSNISQAAEAHLTPEAGPKPIGLAANKHLSQGSGRLKLRKYKNRKPV